MKGDFAHRYDAIVKEINALLRELADREGSDCRQWELFEKVMGSYTSDGRFFPEITSSEAFANLGEEMISGAIEERDRLRVQVVQES